MLFFTTSVTARAMKKYIRKEKWWDKRDFATAVGVSVVMALGFLQGYFAPSLLSLLSHFGGAIVAYVIMRWIAIRRERHELAEIEALEKECDEKMQKIFDLQQKAYLAMSRREEDRPAQ